MKKQPYKPTKIPPPAGLEEINPLVDPEDLIVPEEDPDIIPDEDPFENPPYEAPEPGEGP
jgi:hypothetical protein